MIRERIAEDVYVFTSKRYAQVTCGALVTKEGVVLVDTLYYPDEARAVRDFIEQRLNQHVRYVLLTHYHADHTLGSYLYPQATVVSHAKTRDLLNTIGRKGLEQSQTASSEFGDVHIVLPTIMVHHGTFDIRFGGKTIRMMHLPGHSEDLMGMMLVESGILFASDSMMPVPTFFDGNMEDTANSIKLIETLSPETVVQGHGEVILRGEIPHIVRDHLDYMERIKEEVDMVIEDGLPRDSLRNITIESCGKSHIPLNGLVSELHYANLYRLYDDALSKQGKPVT